MISKALQFTNDVLNQFLKNRFSLDENKVVLNNLIEGNGAIPQINQNKIVLSLINIEKETARPFNIRNNKLVNGNYAEMSPTERYNLDMLVSANFDDYTEALRFLSAVMLFFQVHYTIDAGTSSIIPVGLTKLEFEIEKITYHQMQSLWTAMGAKYQPSVIYKMRLINIQGSEPAGFVPQITNLLNTATA